jgi:queuine tRNA-ribosyltransferase
MAGELLAAVLATHHNVHFYLELMRQIRGAIAESRLDKFGAALRERYSALPA